ncbi:myosin-like protein [Plasmopara halstedii]|uniref:Myosin-like protein n=1 Tax=Plasmopara halstedii TaxID=4781 RepID=A0A0P1APV1_PLAHL|nr:myosin-like protein [Plasmopara halstedii]CEG42852.1 myosin-like protein [Plasmopara halstedii]|eukprot:XP_024579221.1 myosin-like protein [Plasmopara halstedii]
MATRREQRRSLNDSFMRGSISRQEYDELLPFVSSPTSSQTQQESLFDVNRPEAQQAGSVTSSTTHRNVRFADEVNFTTSDPGEHHPQHQMPAPVTAATSSSGLQLRCPACGTSNDMTRSSRCYVCNSRLAVSDEPSASTPRRLNTRQRWPIVTAMTPSNDAFSAADGGRVVFNNGIFSCAMQDTQIVTTAEGSTCEVYVMCCTWQPEGISSQQPHATWYVSQRFSQFERLHKVLKRRFSRSSAVLLPPFPAKYHLTDRLEKRKQGLGIYMPRLLEMCTQLPDGQSVPELDEFLDISHQVQIFQSRRRSNSEPPTASTNSPEEASSLFPAFTGPVILPSQPLAPPMDATELAQAEGAIRLLSSAVRNSRGDVRSDGTVQHHLGVCVQLAPGLQRSVDVENPFADADLIPQALQCQEDLQQAVALYNDALLAASGILPARQQVREYSQHEPHVQSQQMPVGNVVPASAA